MVYNLYAIKNKLVTMNQRLVIICLVISSMIIPAVLTVQNEYVVKTSGNSLSLLGVQIVEAFGLIWRINVEYSVISTL